MPKYLPPMTPRNVPASEFEPRRFVAVLADKHLTDPSIMRMLGAYGGREVRKKLRAKPTHRAMPSWLVARLPNDYTDDLRLNHVYAMTHAEAQRIRGEGVWLMMSELEPTASHRVKRRGLAFGAVRVVLDPFRRVYDRVREWLV